MPDPTDELLQLSQRLLDAIATNDWFTYVDLCDPELTAFEPEARGLRVTGLDFHRYYFDAGPPAEPRNTTMVDPQVRWLGDDAALKLIHQGRGKGGACLDYLQNTIRHLDDLGIVDGPLHRIVRLAEEA